MSRVMSDEETLAAIEGALAAQQTVMSDADTLAAIDGVLGTQSWKPLPSPAPKLSVKDYIDIKDMKHNPHERTVAGTLKDVGLAVPNAMMHRRSPNGQPPVERKILIFLRTGERRFLVGSATRNTPKIRITASSAIRGDAGPHYTVHGNLISVRNGTTPKEIARGLGWPPLVFPAKISHPQASGGCLCPAPRPRSPLRPILKKKAN